MNESEDQTTNSDQGAAGSSPADKSGGWQDAGKGMVGGGGKKPGNKKMMMWLVIALVVILGAVGAYLMMNKNSGPEAKKVPPRTVKVGVMDPISGVFTQAGTSVKRGIEFATKEHAIDGLTIEYVYKDTGCDPAKGTTAANELVTEGVIAVIGDLCSGSTATALKVLMAAHIPVVSATASNPTLSTSADNAGYFSRTIPSDSAAADYTAKLLYTDKKFTKLAIIHEDALYGTGLNDAVTAAFEKLGGKIVTSQKFHNEDTDVKKQVTAIKDSGADALYMVTSSSVTWIAIMQQMKDLGMTLPVYTSESLKDPAFLKDAGSLAEGMNVISISEGTPAYIEKYQGAYNEDPGLYNAQAYDAARAVVEALNTGAAPGQALAKAIRAVSFQGASGAIKFSSTGDIAANYSVFKVVDGKFRAQ